MANASLRVVVILCASFFATFEHAHAAASCDQAVSFAPAAQQEMLLGAPGPAVPAFQEAVGNCQKEERDVQIGNSKAALENVDLNHAEVGNAINEAQSGEGAGDAVKGLEVLQNHGAHAADRAGKSADEAVESSTKAVEAEKKLKQATETASAVSTGYQPSSEPEELQQKSANAVADNKAVKGNLGSAMLPLAALAAGVIGGMMLGKDKGEEKKEEPEEEDDDGRVLPKDISAEKCGPNTVLQGGICVVKSAEDKCYLANGTIDKTKLRNSKGVCVAKNELCETGYSYNDAEKVCKKSNCQEGFTENASGACVANNTTGGGSIALPAPDPLFGDTPEAEEENTDNSTPDASSQGRGTLGNSSSSSSPAASRGAASFQAGSASSGGAASGAYGGGYSGSDRSKDASAGKDAQVQYQPVKWKNPAKTKSLREVMSER